MLPSQKRDIISRVKFIHSNRAKLKKLEEDKNELQEKINTLAQETNHKLGKLHGDMGEHNELKIKLGDIYYTLLKKSTGVEISKFSVIDEKNI